MTQPNYEPYTDEQGQALSRAVQMLRTLYGTAYTGKDCAASLLVLADEGYVIMGEMSLAMRLEELMGLGTRVDDSTRDMDEHASLAIGAMITRWEGQA